MKNVVVFVILTTVILISGCAATKQEEMIWIPATKQASEQDLYQCKQDAAVASGVFSTSGTYRTTATRRKNYEAIFSDCMRSKGYVLEVKERYNQKVNEEKELYKKRGFRIGILVSLADNVDAKILKVSEGGPAEKAGLKVGDIIKKVNKTEISSSLQLIRSDCGLKVGEKATFVVIRDGFSKTFVLIPEKLD